MSVTPSSSRAPPAEEDLLDLYNLVWASYVEDPIAPGSATPSPPPPPLPTTSSRDRDMVYNPLPAGGDLKRYPSATAIPPHVAGAQGRSPGLPSSPRERPLPNPSQMSPTSPSMRGSRPLPRPPGSGPATPAGATMPEARPYSPGGVRPKHTSGDSSRKLPSVPDSSSSTRSPTSSVGSGQFAQVSQSSLLSDTRSTYRQPNGDEHKSPAPSHASLQQSQSSAIYSMPVPDISQVAPDPDYASWSVQGTNGTGALGGSVSYPGGYFPASPSSTVHSLAPEGDVKTHPPPRTTSMAAGAHLRNGSLSMSPSAMYPETGLGRSTSTGSSTSSYQGLLRHPSTTASSLLTPASTTQYMSGPSSSSFATTVDRGDSFRSYTSWNSTESPYPLTHQTSFALSDSMGMPPVAGPSDRRPSGFEQTIESLKGRLGLHEEEELYSEGDSEVADDDRFVNFALLSHLAVRLRDNVPRGTHVKENIPYPRAFTGKDIVSTIQSQIQRELLITHGISTNDRRAALQVARSLQSQLFFYEVEWGDRLLQDGVEDVYMFLDDVEGPSDQQAMREELPTAVITLLTKCYSPSCTDEEPCYAYLCPRKKGSLLLASTSQPVEPAATAGLKEWRDGLDSSILRTLPPSEINRQTIIHKVISKEEQYVHDLDTVESLFIRPLRKANPPIMRADLLEQFIDDVFHNILDLRECNRRLLEHLYVRQREQAPVIQKIGDVFLNAAVEFRLAYPNYIGHLPVSEKRMKEEAEGNAEFRRFLEQCARHVDARRMDLKLFLTRPSEHLQKYPVLLEAILAETVEGNPDRDFLVEAANAIKGLQTGAQLLTFQSAMGKGPGSKLEWHDLVSKEIRLSIPKDEAKRQSIIFELISGEMTYLRDLENLEPIFINSLRNSDSPIIPPQRLSQFIIDVFHNYGQLVFHHRKLLEQLHRIQQDEHPLIHSVTAVLLDAFLNFRDAYLEYIPNYPIAAYRIEDEKATNPRFREFHDQCVRHPDANRQDMKAFINRPIPRLLRYQLLMESVLKETPADHEDRIAIPQLLEVIKTLGKETEPGVASAEQKVDLWRYNANIMFKPGEHVDMDLLDENRSLIHTCKLLRQPETGFEWSGWSELFVLLFDNYLVMTKPKEKDGITKYHVSRRPIPLDLLTLATFTDPPTQRGTGLLRGLRGGGAEKHGDMSYTGGQAAPESAGDSRAVYPCTIHHNGRVGGLYTLYAESAASRAEWKQRLEEAIGLRKIVQESNKVFEIETLSSDTFLIPSVMAGPSAPTWNNDNTFTGKVTCSIPFNTADGRHLMAIGCAEGVWIGFRHDSKSLRRVLHLKMVTQCAMLDEFGIFLVLADKSLFAYHIEALVPSSMQSAQMSQTPQKLSGTKDVHFFTVGNLNNRTLVIYMKKKGLDSVFRVLEPVVGHINDRSRAPVSLGSRLGLRSQRSDWFRTYREFFLPSESYDLIFLKARIAVLCTKGFEIMDLTDFKSVTIPQRDDPKLEKLAKRCESCRPMGMFRSNVDEFLLCYDEFGVYVDRHGDPSRSTSTIEWEGTAERVAWHQPYILLFDSRFIEIRHVESGRLAQIIPGNDIRCIWDGRGAKAGTAGTPAGDGWGADNSVDQEARVHAVMNAPSEPGSTGRAAVQVQHVFELIPTVPLYLPERSPTTSTYFPQAQNGSPPQSPRHSITASGTWRA